MSLDTKIRIAKFKLLFKKKEYQVSPFIKEIQKIAIAIVITEFLLATGFYMLVKHNIYPPKKEFVYVERAQASNGGVVEEDMATTKQVTSSKEEGEIDGHIEPSPLSSRLENLADTIYLKESSNGKNDQKCERLGENSHNGYGYRQGTDKNYCLESDEEMRELVIKDLKIKIDKYPEATDRELLCLYNTGTLSKNCNY